MRQPASLLPFCLLLLGAAEPAREPGPRLVQTLALPGVEGRIDHLAADVQGERLFVAALGSDALEVLDLRAGRRAFRISGLHEPQGVALAGRSGRLFVANGEGGEVGIYDARTGEKRGGVTLSDDADNVRYDAQDDRIDVGYGSGALAALDAATGKVLATTPLGGHPESFQLEQDGRRIFVNVPSSGEIAVVDRDSARVIARWPLASARGNYPMALDEVNHRLFVGCRQPPRLVVLDTDSGREVGGVAIDGDADDVFLDAQAGRLYVACGAGFLDVIAPRDPGSWSVIARVPTAAGARTGLLVPELGRLYLAVPHRGRQQAEVRVYAVGSR